MALGSRIAIAALLCMFLCLSPTTYGQEKPTLTLDFFNYTSSFRSSVCERQVQIDSGTLQLRNSLVGLNLSTWALVDNRYFRFDDSGRIAQDPGLIGVLLDELASRGGFTWRNSFGVLESPILPEGRTYSELLDWTIRTYDVSAAYWLITLARMDLGASFPEGWFDGRQIMVGYQDEDKASLDIWAFLEPFSTGVWIMIGVTVVVSAGVYWFLDWFDTASDDLELHNDPAQSLFLSALTFTGQFEFQPRSNSARLFTASLSFWALIMMSAYTANLASFLVTQNTPSIEINTVGDAVRNSYRICLVGGSAVDEALSRTWPGARVVRTETELETYQGVRDGMCDILLSSVSSWEEMRGDRTINEDCRLGWIGRSFTDGQGGFATKSDSGTLCTSLIRDVLNLHLVEMKEEGFIGRAWEEFLKKQATIDCSAVDSQGIDDEDASGQLSLQAMGGTFIIHYILTAAAVLLAFVWKCRTKYRLKHQSPPSAASKDDKAALASLGNGFTTEKSGGLRLQDLVEKQNEKLKALLSEQNKEILAALGQQEGDAEEPYNSGVLSIKDE